MKKPPKKYLDLALRFYGFTMDSEVTKEQAEKVARLGWTLHKQATKVVKKKGAKPLKSPTCGPRFIGDFLK